MSDSGSDAEMEVDGVDQKVQGEKYDNEGEEEKLEPEDEEEEEPEPEQEVDQEVRPSLIPPATRLTVRAQDALESEEASPPPSPPKQPRLKIKLKLPSVPSTEDTASRGRSGGVFRIIRATDVGTYDVQILTWNPKMKTRTRKQWARRVR